jgi:uncharacterized membrane protein
LLDIKNFGKDTSKLVHYIILAITLGILIVAIIQHASVMKALPDTDKSEAATNARRTSGIMLTVSIIAFVLACINLLYRFMRK